MASTANTVSSDPQPAFNPVSVTDSNGNAVAYQLNPPGIAPEGVTQYYVYTFTNTSVTYTMTFSYISAYSSAATTVSCLAVGGGGGFVSNPKLYKPGCGAGGMVEVTFTMPPSTTEQQISIAAGASGPPNLRGGTSTVIITEKTSADPIYIVAEGGGANGPGDNYYGDGGSGGGGNGASGTTKYDPGESLQTTSYTGFVSGTGYGNAGGYGCCNNDCDSNCTGGAGGGGGAGGVGGVGSFTGSTIIGGAGGAGRAPTLPGIPNTTIYARGGNGWGFTANQVVNGANTGNGGGFIGGSADNSSATYPSSSGIVIIAIPAGAMTPI